MTQAAIKRALKSLDPDVRPGAVRILDAMPLTSWYRPSLDHLTETNHRKIKHEGAPNHGR